MWSGGPKHEWRKKYVSYYEILPYQNHAIKSLKSRGHSDPHEKNNRNEADDRAYTRKRVTSIFFYAPERIEMREMVQLTQKLVAEILEQRKQEKAEKEAEQQRRRLRTRQSESRCYNCNRAGLFARDCWKSRGSNTRSLSPMPLCQQDRRKQFAGNHDEDTSYIRNRGTSPGPDNNWTRRNDHNNNDKYGSENPNVVRSG